MKMMRLVGISSSNRLVWVQTKIRDWVQQIMTFEDFDTWMSENFPTYYANYVENAKDQSAAEYFYNFGESFEMMRKGEAFIFS